MPGKNFVLYVRNFIFGAEDSLVSTVGLLSGVAIGGVAKVDILLTGMVLIFVEAFSMAVGSFLTEYSAEEYVNRAKVSISNPFAGGVVMFFSYLFTGLIPLWPYVVFDINPAFWVSIASSVVGLSLLGVVSARVLRIPLLGSALRMTLIGAVAIAVGALIGQIFKH
ncbi:MAG: hypothetical protein A3J07_04280 [Candidatus Doudnabacteria bacterium RIFCSPLOWO2_02_FULL_49_13]|uniref:VIT family protein n=1 Tax=Candidatus Doudnabacteria bacterium RIFCSPHIGHO2_12_FULL_48_16 TaxID=1817838 RepID=A0A1F5PJR1_9BACT|nr:MAG: hypothetical protein A3B77_03085 [Candidatus Doudnabacteria bacterium RIFCSPHIGHO2_02_FULL_49_24]OGE89139.1 MAG: hypothetical protein A2760_04220 [Candidatus Doudnabacteria bacterium RIFCSPHIGHO2_01_FULL_50_67]OGE90131.1 MAG: hypothetical protein A3E29_03420 [Candidatus Doudnabacteria bacterium RIFCSPHIGHO2_12_FULL_48_16]OGF03274.1 MAG: hypothetical protein A3J07_04280 [Candidatus Doudnabacteria bacterium RIFCSPLOWO2_02_FULL_49_13]OGF03820.1 MAG: hypothetical protein A3H14_04120 [Candid